MKLGFFERLYTNNPLRGALQRPWEFWLFRRIAPIPAQAHILEIGCGNGAGLHWLATHASPASVTGVDLDPGQVALARRRLSTLAIPYNVLPANAAQIPLPAQSYDVIFSIGCLQRVPAWQQALAETVRLLRPGGLLYVLEFHAPFHRGSCTPAALAAELERLGYLPLGSSPSPTGPFKRLLGGIYLLSVHRLATLRPGYD